MLPPAPQTLAGKSLGILLTQAPGHPLFAHALSLAEAALAARVVVYAYCLDDAVLGLDDTRLQRLRQKGLVLYACAYGARRRQIPLATQALFAGLSALSDIITATDRFICL